MPKPTVTYLSATFPAAEHHRPLAGTKSYWLMTEAHVCEQRAGCCRYYESFMAWSRTVIESRTPQPLHHHAGHWVGFPNCHKPGLPGLSTTLQEALCYSIHLSFHPSTHPTWSVLVGIDMKFWCFQFMCVVWDIRVCVCVCVCVCVSQRVSLLTPTVVAGIKPGFHYPS